MAGTGHMSVWGVANKMSVSGKMDPTSDGADSLAR